MPPAPTGLRLPPPTVSSPSTRCPHSRPRSASLSPAPSLPFSSARFPCPRHTRTQPPICHLAGLPATAAAPLDKHAVSTRLLKARAIHASSYAEPSRTSVAAAGVGLRVFGRDIGWTHKSGASDRGDARARSDSSSGSRQADPQKWCQRPGKRSCQLKSQLFREHQKVRGFPLGWQSRFGSSQDSTNRIRHRFKRANPLTPAAPRPS